MDTMLITERGLLVRGNDSKGKLGLGGKFINYFKEINFEIPLVQRSTAFTHSLLLDQAGQVWVSGSGYYGELGLGEQRDVLRFTLVPDLPPIKKILASLHCSLLLDYQGQVWATGYDCAGELGLGGNDETFEHFQVVLHLPPVVDMTTQECCSLFLAEDGVAWICGSSQYGTFGLDKEGRKPRPMAHLPSIVAVAAGASHLLLLDKTGIIWSCDNNAEGQLGRPMEKGLITDKEFEPVEGLPPIKSIIAGSLYSVCFDQEGILWRTEENVANPTIPTTTFVRVNIPSKIIDYESHGDGFFLDQDLRLWIHKQEDDSEADTQWKLMQEELPTYPLIVGLTKSVVSRGRRTKSARRAQLV